MQVTIIENSLEPEDSKTFIIDDNDLRGFLVGYFIDWPETAKIYHGAVCQQNDVTPTNEQEVEALATLEGDFTVIVYPGALIAAIAVVVLLIAVVAVTALKKKPTVALTDTSESGSSSNNSLSNRSNKGRPNERIPDIYGTVRSVPDLISSTYYTYDNNQQIEHAFMCIGRGQYDVTDIRDDQTLISQIDGSAVEVYAPGTSPNTGNPQLRIGSPIGDPVRTVIESSSVSQQELLAPNGLFYTATNKIGVTPSGQIYTTDTSVNFNDLFKAGTVVNLALGAMTYSYTDGTGTHSASFDASGSYTVGSISPDSQHIQTTDYLGSPPWNLFVARNGIIDGAKSGSIISTASNWVGPFLIELPNINEIITNFVASNGLYQSDGTNYSPVNVQLQYEVTPVDAALTPIAPPQTYNFTMNGSGVSRTQRASTQVQGIGRWQRVLVRARRVSQTDINAQQTADTVLWQNLYGSRIETLAAFGNVTTVLSLTRATDQSTAIGSRKLNMQVQRYVRARLPDNTIPTNLTLSNDAADIFCTVCLDPYIGNRDISELDVDGIYTEINRAANYFGTDYATQFCYTFDDKTLSFEETISTIADVAFCNAYRQGMLLKVFFERQTTDSTLLFNHRNKIPNSETRTVRFGTSDGYDGIEFTYVDPGDEATITLYIPTDKSATNAKQIKGVGIRNNVQAHFHAWRLYQKMIYQNINVEFTGTAESKLLTLNERILLADNTRTGTQDGEVASQSGLVLQLSQPVVFSSGKTYAIFLQYADGSVDSIDITAGIDVYHVVLATAPLQELSTDSSNYAKTTYIIVASDDTNNRAFLVSASEPEDNYSSKLTVINYSDQYYTHDLDFISGAIRYADYVDNGEL